MTEERETIWAIIKFQAFLFRGFNKILRRLLIFEKKNQKVYRMPLKQIATKKS